MTDLAPLLARITDKRDDLIALPQDLIRIPTLNPPGDHYRVICDYLYRRLSAHGFTTELIRAQGTPGDDENYPRRYIVVRRTSYPYGDYRHFKRHTAMV